MWSTSTSGFATCNHHQGVTPVLGNNNSRNEANAGDATQSKSSKAVCSAAPATRPATERPGRTALPTVSAAQPADRLKLLAARSRTDKLRAAAQQLRATSPVDAAAVQEVQPVAAPAAATAAPDTWGAPAVHSANSTDCDLDELLDDISLGLEPASLLAQPGPLYTSLHKPCARSRAASSQPVCFQARRVLAEATADGVAGGCQPSALGVASQLDNPSVVHAAVQAGDELGVCSSSSSPGKGGTAGEGSPISTGTVDTAPYAQPQQQQPSDLLAATAAMQRRLERLQRSLSSLGSGATPPSSSACRASTASDLVKDDSPSSCLRDPQPAAERDPLAGMHPTGVAVQQAQPRRLTSAAMVVTQAPPPAMPAAGAPAESPVSAAEQAQRRPDYTPRRLDFFQPSRATLGQTSRASTAPYAPLQQQPWESLPLRQPSSLARSQPPVSSVSMLAHRPYSAASSLAATSADILEAWRARRRAEQQQQADVSSPASSTGSTAGQRPLSRFLHNSAPRDPPAAPFCLSSQQHVPPLERPGHMPRSSQPNSSTRLSSMHPAAAAQPGLSSPERRYSRYMSLIGSTAGSSALAAPRPVSTPPTAVGAHSGTVHAQHGSTAAAADLLMSRRTQNAEPARCTLSASRSGMQDDILERWRARRRQLQQGGSGFSAAASGGGSSGYDYASLLLLHPGASSAQGSSEVPGRTAATGPSSGAAARRVEGSAAVPPPGQATATAAAPQPAVSSVDGLDNAGAQLARLSAVLQQHGMASPALALPAPAATEVQQLLASPSRACAAARQRDPSLEGEEQQGEEEVQLASSVSGARPEARQQLLLLAPSRESSCPGSRCSSGQATPRSSCPTDGRQSSMWSPSMNLLVDDLIGATLFDAPLAPEPSSSAGADEGSGPEAVL